MSVIQVDFFNSKSRIKRFYLCTFWTAYPELDKWLKKKKKIVTQLVFKEFKKILTPLRKLDNTKL